MLLFKHHVPTLWCLCVQVMNNFLPSAVKFHYQFNLRETSNIVGGMCRMTKDVYRQPVQVSHLECSPAAAEDVLWPLCAC